MSKLKSLWAKIIAWAASKGVSKKGVISTILGFILGAVIF